MRPSPFVVGQWVRGGKFYGRGSLVQEILEGHRNCVWLLGTRRIGKTSLLKQLELLASSATEPVYFPLFWDFQGAEDPEELHQGFRDALVDASDRLERLDLKPDDVEGRDVFDSLGELRRRVRTSGRKLLLLCDEVEELIKLSAVDPSLLRKLRRVMQSQEDIRSVLASTIRLWALADVRGDTSPFLHGFAPPLYIHTLSDDEARALIRQQNLPESDRPTMDEAVVEAIRSKCDNHPYLIQLVCKRYFELSDLDEALEQVAADPMVSYFFSVDFEMLSPAERDVLQVIAEKTSADSGTVRMETERDDEELRGTLHRLQNLGYVRRNAEKQFELVNHFFRKWLRTRSKSSPSPDSSPPTVRAAEEAATQEQRLVLDGRYRLVRQIGKGATGIVFEARDDVLRETVAIKVLKPEYSDKPEALERFRQEILLSRDIGHPNIAKVYHLGDWNGQKYITMKWVEGMTLGTWISRGPLPIGAAIQVARKLASALEAAHAKRVIHRDIKPENVLIDETGEPYLTDFGLARLAGSTGMTVAGVFLGTPDYASPEQANLQPIDERADIYSLGVVLFEMLVGRPPFTAPTIAQILDMHRASPPPDPRTFRPEIPHVLAGVVGKCLEKEPARRYPTARELRLSLESAERITTTPREGDAATLDG